LATELMIFAHAGRIAIVVSSEMAGIPPATIAG